MPNIRNKVIDAIIPVAERYNDSDTARFAIGDFIDWLDANGLAIVEKEVEQDNSARNRSIVINAFADAEPAIVDKLNELIGDAERGRASSFSPKVVAWSILDIMTKH